MSETNEPHAASSPPPGEAPYVIPVRYPPQPPRPSGGSILSWLFWRFAMFVLTISLGLNFLLLMVFLAGGVGDLGDGGANNVVEKYHSGKTNATDKIVILKVDGVIMEGALGFVHKEIEAAAADEHVKAVVLRINSPGGSITASDDLYRRLHELSEGKLPNQKGGKKPLIVSMASMAASGGYYIAMPADKILAEKTTITGSIGVYASFPTIEKLAKDYGFGMNVIKDGDLKASGSMFEKMSPQEKRLWQDMVDHAYDRFIEVVETGRPELKGKLRKDVKVVERKIPGDDGKEVDYVRYRADGGIYTADDALKYGLIDQVGYLEDAITVAKKEAKLDDPRVVTYNQPPSFSSLFLGAKASSPTTSFDPSAIAAGVTPRLWYMASQSELAGILAAMQKE